MVCLTSEEDSKWRKMRYLPITKVLEHFEQEHKKDLRYVKKLLDIKYKNSKYYQ